MSKHPLDLQSMEALYNYTQTFTVHVLYIGQEKLTVTTESLSARLQVSLGPGTKSQVHPSPNQAFNIYIP